MNGFRSALTTPSVLAAEEDHGFFADLLNHLVAIAVVVGIAVVVRFVILSLLERMSSKATAGIQLTRRPRRHGRRPAPFSPADPRRQARVEGVASLLRSLVTIIVASIAVLYVMAILGIDIGPLLTSAGILGVAISFGAQQLVRDYLAGIAIILEDQYGVGDRITAGEATGVVTAVNLRTTRVTDDLGQVWYLRNGALERVANAAQGWGQVLLDVRVAPDADLQQVQTVLRRAVDRVWASPEIAGHVQGSPTVELQSVDGLACTLRVAGRAEVGDSDLVTRAIWREVRTDFAAAGVAWATTPR